MVIYDLIGRFWRPIIGFMILGGIFVFRDHLSGPAGALRAGDCFDVAPGATAVSDVMHHPCNERHTAEIFVVLKYPAAAGWSYPSPSAFYDFGNRECAGAFVSYAGFSLYTRNDLNAGMLYPKSTGWANGDRDITCYVSRLDNSAMTASLRATGTAPAAPSASPMVSTVSPARSPAPATHRSTATPRATGRR